MKLKDIRVRNLNLLISKYGRTIVREKAGFPDSNHLNQLVRGHGAFGEKTAKRFENGFDLPELWMSTPHYAEWEDTSLEVSEEEFDTQVDQLLGFAAQLPKGKQKDKIIEAVQKLLSI